MDIFEKSLFEISKKFPSNSDTVINIFFDMLNKPNVQKDIEKQGSIFIYIGREYKYKKQDVAKAQMYYEKSLKLAQTYNNCVLEINALTHIALIYHELNKMDDKINAFEKTIDISKKCPESAGMCYVYTQLGLAFSYKEDLNKAEEFFLKADSVLNKRNDIALEISNFAYSCIVSFFNDQKQHSKAVYYARKAFDTAYKKRGELNYNEVEIYGSSINIFKNIGEIDSALYYAHLLQKLSTNNHSNANNEFIISSNRYLSELYELKKDTAKALYYERRYSFLTDSVLKSNYVNYSSDKFKALEDQLALEKKQNEVKTQRIITWAITGLSAILLIALCSFYSNSKKLKKLNTTLEAQKQELTSLNEIRTKMFSIVSHDLLSPIGALKNIIDLYQSKIISKEDFNTYTLDLKHNLNAIIDNLNNILDWSYAQLKGKKPFIEPLNVHKIIEDQLDLQAEVARQKDIILINDVLPDFSVDADFNQFSLIIRNLVNNALKFTPNGGKITISSFYTEGGKAIEVKDTGIGMSEEKVKTLFNNTEKRNNTGTYKGTGLGLQMVNDFLIPNNCTISVKSKEHEGSVFTLIFVKK